MRKHSKRVVRGIVFISLLFLVGCGKKEVDIAQIQADIPQEVKELKIDDTTYDLEVSSIKVETRLATEDFEKIYCNLVMECEEYRVGASYVAKYEYDRQDGWTFVDYWLAGSSVLSP